MKMSHQTDVEGSFACPRSRILRLLLTTRRFYRLACFIWFTESSQNNPQQKVFCWKNIHMSITRGGWRSGSGQQLYISWYIRCVWRKENNHRTARQDSQIADWSLTFQHFFFFLFCCFHFYSIKFIGLYKELLRIKLFLTKTKKEKPYVISCNNFLQYNF